MARNKLTGTPWKGCLALVAAPRHQLVPGGLKHVRVYLFHSTFSGGNAIGLCAITVRGTINQTERMQDTNEL